MAVAVLAHPSDAAAAQLVKRWASYGARLLTSSDLSRVGWCTGDGLGPDAAAVIGGNQVPERHLRGVLIRTPWIEPAELTRIVPEDRDYCAAEMTAFLAWWLSGLACTVANRPTAASLAGPGWSEVRWRRAARQLEIEATPCQWSVAGRHPPVGPASFVDVTVVGGRCVGLVPGDLADRAIALAAAADAEALLVRFDRSSGNSRFEWAEPWVDVSDPIVADALLERFLGSPSANGHL